MTVLLSPRHKVGERLKWLMIFIVQQSREERLPFPTMERNRGFEELHNSLATLGYRAKSERGNQIRRLWLETWSSLSSKNFSILARFCHALSVISLLWRTLY